MSKHTDKTQLSNQHGKTSSNGGFHRNHGHFTEVAKCPIQTKRMNHGYDEPYPYHGPGGMVAMSGIPSCY